MAVSDNIDGPLDMLDGAMDSVDVVGSQGKSLNKW